METGAYICIASGIFQHHSNVNPWRFYLTKILALSIIDLLINPKIGKYVPQAVNLALLLKAFDIMMLNGSK